MRVFPSIPAAIVAGAVVAPIHAWGWNHLKAGDHGSLAQFLWMVIGCFVPVLVSTADLRYVLNHWRNGRSFLQPWASREDFQRFYLPAWRRMLVWFVSVVASMLLLRVAGIVL